MQDDQKRPCHRADDSKTHEEVRDALLDHGGGFDDRAAEFGAFAFFGGDYVQLGFVDREGVGVDGGLVRCIHGCVRGDLAVENEGVWMYLWDETVGHWDPSDAGEKGRAAEEEEVPVESSGFLQRKLSCLRGEAAHVLAGC